ncbi:hypothetical protein SLEP1_g53088 [Rubroshorea leprosula]|uniref:Uncharacterized protein n=1 Tax=Rubroshorea leprosula TaxID=152421 RepID=A0AAV5MB36_9ROSI|nr:hypothetical protein SLEP1_g53088 [Rubroshorea leprosula]
MKRFGFDDAHIELLADTPRSLLMPIGANIKVIIDQMVDKAKAGDAPFFHYGGNGIKIPSMKPGHPFRQNEVIVPCDFNLIIESRLKEICSQLKEFAIGNGKQKCRKPATAFRAGSTGKNFKFELWRVWKIDAKSALTLQPTVRAHLMHND